MERALLTSIKVTVALVLMAPLIVMAPPLPVTIYPLIVGKALYARTLIEVAFGLWIVLSLAHPTYRMPRSRLMAILALYVLVTLLASAAGVGPQRSLWSTYERMQGAIDLVHWLAFTLLLAAVFRSWAAWRALLSLNVGVGVFIGLVGVAQRLDLLAPGYLGPSERFGITFGNPSYLGAYMAVITFIALGVLGRSLADAAAGGKAGGIASGGRARWETWLRVFWLGAAGLDAATVYLSASRGALLGLLAGLAVFAAGYMAWGRVRHIKRVSLAAAVSILAGLLVLALLRDTPAFHAVAGSQTMLSRVAATGAADPSVTGRTNAALNRRRPRERCLGSGWRP
jgi:hypothetical protein